jgi:hypothetical protein
MRTPRVIHEEADTGESRCRGSDGCRSKRIVGAGRNVVRRPARKLARRRSRYSVFPASSRLRRRSSKPVRSSSPAVTSVQSRDVGDCNGGLPDRRRSARRRARHVRRPRTRRVVATLDGVQKVHPVAQNLAVAFAGSVVAGFTLIEDLARWLSGIEPGRSLPLRGPGGKSNPRLRLTSTPAPA